MTALNGHAYPNGSNGNGRETSVPDRLPPQNLEAEQGVLGSILLDNDVLAQVIDFLKVEHFYRDTHQVIYAAFLELHTQGKPIDTISLAEHLTHRDEFARIGGDETMLEIIDGVPHAANGKYYAEIVVQKAAARQLIAQATDLIQKGYSNNYSADDLLQIAENGVSAISRPFARADDIEINLRPWPDEPDADLWHGLSADLVFKIAPQTEADPMAILGQFLVAFGNIIGRKPHWTINASRHGCNLFLCNVGNSSKARKGTSWDIVRWLLRDCDPDWSSRRILGGLSSGEGLIWSVRDAIYRREKQGALFQEIMVDPGEIDKRALFVETEFGSTLSAIGREGNTLSGYIRRAWDSGDFASTTKNNPARTTGAHCSIIGHITNEELHRRLTDTEAANGFANRFLWVCVRRSRYLPHGGRLNQLDFVDIERRLSDAVSYAKGEFETDEGFVIVRDQEADRLWERAYVTLSEPKAGLLGSVVSRAEAQVMRLAMIYALLDCSSIIRYVHLKAALAFWKYCEQSAAYIFGESMGVPNADRVLEAILAAEDEGLTQNEIVRRVFSGRQPREPKGGMAEILASLSRSGLVEAKTVATKGRPATRWTRVRKETPCDTAT